MDHIEKCLRCPKRDCTNCMSRCHTENVGGRPSSYDAARMERFMLLGYSMREIAERSDVSERTAYRWTRRYLQESGAITN